MQTQKQYQVRAQRPSNVKFGDFIVTDVNFDSETAIADFGNGAKAPMNISLIMPKIRSYSGRNKKYYVRAI